MSMSLQHVQHHHSPPQSKAVVPLAPFERDKTLGRFLSVSHPGTKHQTVLLSYYHAFLLLSEHYWHNLRGINSFYTFQESWAKAVQALHRNAAATHSGLNYIGCFLLFPGSLDCNWKTVYQSLRIWNLLLRGGKIHV